MALPVPTVLILDREGQPVVGNGVQALLQGLLKAGDAFPAQWRTNGLRVCTPPAPSAPSAPAAPSGGGEQKAGASTDQSPFDDDDVARLDESTMLRCNLYVHRFLKPLPHHRDRIKIKHGTVTHTDT